MKRARGWKGNYGFLVFPHQFFLFLLLFKGLNECGLNVHGGLVL